MSPRSSNLCCKLTHGPPTRRTPDVPADMGSNFLGLGEPTIETGARGRWSNRGGGAGSAHENLISGSRNPVSSRIAPKANNLDDEVMVGQRRDKFLDPKSKLGCKSMRYSPVNSFFCIVCKANSTISCCRVGKCSIAAWSKRSTHTELAHLSTTHEALLPLRSPRSTASTAEGFAK